MNNFLSVLKVLGDFRLKMSVFFETNQDTQRFISVDIC